MYHTRINAKIDEIEKKEGKTMSVKGFLSFSLTPYTLVWAFLQWRVGGPTKEVRVGQVESTGKKAVMAYSID